MLDPYCFSWIKSYEKILNGLSGRCASRRSGITGVKSRDGTIERIAELTKQLHGNGKLARKSWEHESDYPSRSIIGTRLFRFKTLCEEKLFLRLEASQEHEEAVL